MYEILHIFDLIPFGTLRAKDTINCEVEVNFKKCRVSCAKYMLGAYNDDN